MTANLQGVWLNSTKESTILLDENIYKMLKEKADGYQLSAVGKILARFRKEMLFASPPKEEAERFLDECLYDSRLAKIRKSLEDYINGRTDIIMEL